MSTEETNKYCGTLVIDPHDQSIQDSRDERASACFLIASEIMFLPITRIAAIASLNI